MIESRIPPSAACDRCGHFYVNHAPDGHCLGEGGSHPCSTRCRWPESRFTDDHGHPRPPSKRGTAFPDTIPEADPIAWCWGSEPVVPGIPDDWPCENCDHPAGEHKCAYRGCLECRCRRFARPFSIPSASARHAPTIEGNI